MSHKYQAQASDVEIHVEDTLLTVHINPYFLRLTFPGRVLEDDTSDAKYDPSSGHLILTLTKETRGEYFKDLDVLAKLLAPYKRREEEEPKGPVIEVIGSGEGGCVDEDGNDESEVEKSLMEEIERLNLEQEEIIESLTQGIARLSDELDNARKRVSPLFDIDRASSISPSPFSGFDDDF